MRDIAGMADQPDYNTPPEPPPNPHVKYICKQLASAISNLLRPERSDWVIYFLDALTSSLVEDEAEDVLRSVEQHITERLRSGQW